METLPNPLLLFSAQVIAILSILLLAAGYLKTDPRAASARVFAFMALMVVLYLLNGMTASHIDPQFQLNLFRLELLITIGMNTICGLFMIYCFLIFQEQQKFPVTLSAAFAMQVFLDAILSFLALSDEPVTSTGSSALLTTSM
ncbi:MAG TPA: hypothetical protein DCM64_11045, partial [Gammaproteobacteria bacterium]|nr:hypothetical protein [Gammaproteobacteria bacterium]